MNITDHIKPEQFNDLKEIHIRLNEVTDKLSTIYAAIAKNNKIIADNADPIDNASLLRNTYHQALANADLGIIDKDTVDNHHAEMKSAEALDDQHNANREEITKKANSALLGLNTMKDENEKILSIIKEEKKACEISTLVDVIKQQALDYEQKALDTIESFKILLSLERLMVPFTGKQNATSGVFPYQGGLISLPAINSGNQKRIQTVINGFNDAFLIGIKAHFLIDDDSIKKLSLTMLPYFCTNPGEEK